MAYLLVGLNKEILNVSDIEPVLEEEGNLRIWRFEDGSGIMNRGFTCVEVKSIPNGMIPNKYCYWDGEFAINPNYIEPVVTLQQYFDLYNQNKMLTETVEGQSNRTAEAELESDYRLSMLELGLA